MVCQAEWVEEECQEEWVGDDVVLEEDLGVDLEVVLEVVGAKPFYLIMSKQNKIRT